MSQKSPTPKSRSGADSSNQAENTKPVTGDEIVDWEWAVDGCLTGYTPEGKPWPRQMTVEELCQWAFGTKELPKGFDDGTEWIRRYEMGEDEEEDAEEEKDDDFDWVKFTEESRARRAKEAESSEPKKV